METLNETRDHLIASIRSHRDKIGIQHSLKHDMYGKACDAFTAGDATTFDAASGVVEDTKTAIAALNKEQAAELTRLENVDERLRDQRIEMLERTISGLLFERAIAQAALGSIVYVDPECTPFTPENTTESPREMTISPPEAFEFKNPEEFSLIITSDKTNSRPPQEPLINSLKIPDGRKDFNQHILIQIPGREDIHKGGLRDRYTTTFVPAFSDLERRSLGGMALPPVVPQPLGEEVRIGFEKHEPVIDRSKIPVVTINLPIGEPRLPQLPLD